MKYVILEYGVAEGTSNPTGEVVDSNIEKISKDHMDKMVKVLRKWLDTRIEIVSLPYKHAESWLRDNWQDVLVMSASVGDLFNSGFLRQYKGKIYQCCSSSNEGPGTIGGLAEKGYFNAIGAVDADMNLLDYSSYKDDHVDYVGIADEYYDGVMLRGTTFSNKQHGANVANMQLDYYLKEKRRMTIEEVEYNLRHYVVYLGNDGGVKDKETGYGYFEYKGEYMTIPKDLHTAPTWAQDSLQRMVNDGVLQGDENGNIHPNEPLTLARYAVLRDRDLGK